MNEVSSRNSEVKVQEKVPKVPLPSGGADLRLPQEAKSYDFHQIMISEAAKLDNNTKMHDY